MVVPEDDIWVGRCLRELGEHSQTELNMMEFTLGLMTKGLFDSTVIDAGAYIGDLTIPLSRMCKKVYAFEPQESIRELLLHNLQVNCCRNVEVLPYALGSEPSMLNYCSAGAENSPGSTIMGDPSGDAQVEQVTLDALGLDPDFIKADVEGMECHLLAGAVETLSRTRATLFMECDTVVVEGVDLRSALDSLGYRQHPMDFPMWNPQNFNGVKVNTFGSTVAHMILAYPQMQRANA